jgi:hypothetical protein
LAGGISVTPEAAVDALLTAFKNSDDSALSALFGAEYAGHLLSKDKVAARQDRERLYQEAQKSLTLKKETAFRPGQYTLVARPTGGPPGTLPSVQWRRQMEIDPRVRGFKLQFNEADFK